MGRSPIGLIDSWLWPKTEPDEEILRELPPDPVQTRSPAQLWLFGIPSGYNRAPRELPDTLEKSHMRIVSLEDALQRETERGWSKQHEYARGYRAASTIAKNAVLDVIKRSVSWKRKKEMLLDRFEDGSDEV